MSQSGSTTTSATSSCCLGPAEFFQFPSHYQLLEHLGAGCYGTVMKCFNTDTQEVLAVKIQVGDLVFDNEVFVMEELMKNNLHEKNIIRFVEAIPLNEGFCGLVYELLDVTLQQHLVTNKNTAPLDLQSIRSVIQQLAIALDALKSLEIIHTDLKTDNIMLMDAKHKPLQVRLIDFGMSLPTYDVEPGGDVQPLDYMAPEIILGLPYSEAIDMWSLGIVLMEMLTGDTPFAAMDKYGQLANMVEILGLPPDDLLEAGMYTDLYFNRSQTGQWVLKKPKEYWQDLPPPDDERTFSISNLDQVRLFLLTGLDGVDADKLNECIDLLKAIFQFDAGQRITPSQVLMHPFIMRGNLQQSLVENTKSNQETRDIPTETARPRTAVISGKGRPSLPTVSPVQPAETVCCQSQDENEGLNCSHSNETFESPHLRVRTIIVKPAPPERCLKLVEDTEADFDRLSCQPSPPIYSEDSSASDDTDPEDVQPPETKKKKKKKKNVFTRFCRWVKTNFLCCNNAVNVMD